MRTLAVIANLALLAVTGVMLATEEISLEGMAIPLFLLMIAAPILSLVALALRGVASKDWLAGYFERKAMEERRKMELLRNQRPQTAAPPNDGPAMPAGNSAGRAL